MVFFELFQEVGMLIGTLRAQTHQYLPLFYARFVMLGGFLWIPGTNRGTDRTTSNTSCGGPYQARKQRARQRKTYSGDSDGY